MSSWLDDILKQHEELEAPENFWRWAALAAISAILKDNVWMDMQIHNIYPNIYVMFHADSGLRKGAPVAMARRLVQAVGNTRIITGRSSIQGILKELGTSYTEPGGKINAGSKCFICSSELTSSIVDDPIATGILTDLYDRNYNVGSWRSLLKMESFDLKDPTITMLSATNESMSQDFLSVAAIKGGYFARTFIIYEKEARQDNSLLFPLETKPDYTQFAEYLKVLSTLKGAFEPIVCKDKSDIFKYKVEKFGRVAYFNEAGYLYETWYNEFKKIVRGMDTKDETGTLNRFGDSVLKVAMLLSLAEKPEKILTAKSVEEAIKECEKLLGNIRHTTLGKTATSTSATFKVAVIMELLNRETHQISSDALMRKLIMHFSSATEFAELMMSLEQAGVVKSSSLGNKIIYEMSANQVEEYKRFFAGKARKNQ